MSLSNTFLPAAAYNKLPHISVNAQVPNEYLKDLENLRNLLGKYNLPSHIAIRLVHKHSDVLEGEVMVIKPARLPSYGDIEIMQPTKDLDPAKIYPVHYFVDEGGYIQAYEYSCVKPEVPCSDSFEAFLVEFRNLVLARGLQNRFGLKIDCENEPARCTSETGQQINWAEFEYPERRGTILIQSGMPEPEGDFEAQVTTEWYGLPHVQRYCIHNSCRHCRNHGVRQAEIAKCIENGIFSFGGHPVAPQTPFHNLLTQVIEAW